MKKIALALAFVLSVSVFADAYKFPGWESSVSVYDDYIAQYENAKEDQKPFFYYEYERLITAKAISGKQFGSIDEIIQLVDSLNVKRKELVIVTIASCNNTRLRDKNQTLGRKIMRDCYDYIVKTNNIEAIYAMTISKYYTSEAGINADEVVNFLFDGLLNGKIISLINVKKAVDQLCVYCPLCSMKPEKQLENFKTLNRMYSINLIEGDKEKWEPIVAKLRTVIASY